MTKKHFIALADMIKRANAVACWPDGQFPFMKAQINILADFCQSQNPNFNRERWLSYVAGEFGKNGGKVKQAV